MSIIFEFGIIAGTGEVIVTKPLCAVTDAPRFLAVMQRASKASEHPLLADWHNGHGEKPVGIRTLQDFADYCRMTGQPIR